VSPTGASTAELLDALDRVREVRGSVPLFDALAAGDAERVRMTLVAWPRHPLHGAIVAWLGERGLAPPEAESPVAALARHGIDDVDAYVQAAHLREATLSRALDAALAEKSLALRSANAYALIVVLLAIVAIGGWFSALGGLPLPEAPTPDPPAAAPRVAPAEPRD